MKNLRSHWRVCGFQPYLGQLPALEGSREISYLSPPGAVLFALIRPQRYDLDLSLQFMTPRRSCMATSPAPSLRSDTHRMSPPSSIASRPSKQQP